jgi:hypothetical protein
MKGVSLGKEVNTNKYRTFYCLKQRMNFNKEYGLVIEEATDIFDAIEKTKDRLLHYLPYWNPASFEKVYGASDITRDDIIVYSCELLEYSDFSCKDINLLSQIRKLTKIKHGNDAKFDFYESGLGGYIFKYDENNKLTTIASFDENLYPDKKSRIYFEYFADLLKYI